MWIVLYTAIRPSSDSPLVLIFWHVFMFFLMLIHDELSECKLLFYCRFRKHVDNCDKDVGRLAVCFEITIFSY